MSTNGWLKILSVKFTQYWELVNTKFNEFERQKLRTRHTMSAESETSLLTAAADWTKTCHILSVG